MREKVISEKRLVTRLTKYWELLKKDRQLPMLQKFHSSAVAEIWDNCFVLELSESDRDRKFIFKYFGSEIKRAYGENLTGRKVNISLRSVPGAKVIAKIEDCIDGKITVEERGAFVNAASKTVKFRSCMLPFCSKDGGEVTHVIVGLSWRAF